MHRNRDVTATFLLSRLRHFRGHGIHSPFVYDLVREVFSSHKQLVNECELFERLRRSGVDRRTAERIQNLSDFCASHDGDMAGEPLDDDCRLRIVLPDALPEEVERIFTEPDVTFVVVYPYKNKHKLKSCMNIAEGGNRLTIDAKSMFIVFEGRQLPKQHFKI